MQLLGKSLDNIFEEHNKKFSIKTICMIGIQILDRIEYMHSKHLVHGDIKPDNFVLGLNEESHIIYIIDLGLCQKYRSAITLKHLPFKEKTKFIGTPRYASINSLKRYKLSRRDDLESMGYSLIYFLRGNLPWQGLQVNFPDDRKKRILEKKESISAEELCKGFPIEFTEFLNYARKLEYEQEPDYKYLRGLLYNVLSKENCTYDFWYDWVSDKPIIKDQIAIERYINKNIDYDMKCIKEDENSNKNKIKKEEKKEWWTLDIKNEWKNLFFTIFGK